MNTNKILSPFCFLFFSNIGLSQLFPVNDGIDFNGNSSFEHSPQQGYNHSTSNGFAFGLLNASSAPGGVLSHSDNGGSSTFDMTSKRHGYTWNWNIGTGSNPSFNTISGATYFSKWEMKDPANGNVGVSALVLGHPDLNQGRFSTNFQIFDPGNNELSAKLSSNSSNYLKNNLGIGKANPSATLDVEGNAIIRGVIRGDNLIPAAKNIDQLREIISLIGSQEGSVLIADDIIVGDIDVNIPKNISVTFLRGSVFSLGGSGRVIIRGDLDAGPYKIFSSAGDDTRLRQCKILSGETIFAEWFGAVGNDGIDDWASIQAALEAETTNLAVNPHSGATVKLLGKKYDISAPLRLSGQNNRRLEGVAPRKTMLRALSNGDWTSVENLVVTEDFPSGTSALIFIGDSSGRIGSFGCGVSGIQLNSNGVPNVGGILATGWLEEGSYITDCLIGGFISGYGIGMPSVHASGKGQVLNGLVISRITIGPSLSNYDPAAPSTAPIPLKLRGEEFVFEKSTIDAGVRGVNSGKHLPYLIKVTSGMGASLRDLHLEGGITGILCVQQGPAPNLQLEINRVSLLNTTTLPGIESQCIEIRDNAVAKATIHATSVTSSGATTYTINDKGTGKKSAGASSAITRRFTGTYTRSYFENEFQILTEDPNLKLNP